MPRGWGERDGVGKLKLFFLWLCFLCASCEAFKLKIANLFAFISFTGFNILYYLNFFSRFSIIMVLL